MWTTKSLSLEGQFEHMKRKWFRTHAGGESHPSPAIIDNGYLSLRGVMPPHRISLALAPPRYFAP
jgi:hypothetical protein